MTPQVPVNTPIFSHSDLHSTRLSWADKKSRYGRDRGRLQSRKDAPAAGPGSHPSLRLLTGEPPPSNQRLKRHPPARGFGLTPHVLPTLCLL